MSYKNSLCFVLKSVNYRDADKIYTLYSQEEGRISAIARGVRKISSKRAGGLDTLNLASLTYFGGKNGHKTITEVKSLKSFRRLKANPGKVAVAYKIIALLLKHVEEDSPDSKLFSALEKTLNLLDDSVVSDVAVLSYFYIHFMYSLGYRLQLTKCSFCGDKLRREWGSAWFSIEKGGLVCPLCKNFEEEIGLRGAALLNKLQFLSKDSPQYFNTGNTILARLEGLLHRYLQFKL